MADARRLRPDSERAFRLARAGVPSFSMNLMTLDGIFSYRLIKSSAMLIK